MLLLSLGTSLMAQMPQRAGKHMRGNSVAMPNGNTGNMGNMGGTTGFDADGNPITDTNDGPQVRGIEYHIDIPDTTLQRNISKFHLLPFQTKIMEVEHPVFNAYGAQWFDKLDAIDGTYYLSKGLIGQSHTTLYPRMGATLGWQYQPDVNIGYARTLRNVDFYQVQRPYSILGYQSSLRKEYQIRAVHTQNILPRWNFAFDADFCNPNEIYSNSTTKNTHLDVTTNYYSIDARYQVYGGFILEKLRIGENGGMKNDNEFRNNNSSSNLAGLPIRNATAGNIFTNTTLFAHQQYNFERQVTRTRERMVVKSSLVDSISSDTTFVTDTLYARVPRTVNWGLLGNDIQWKRHSRKYADSTITDEVGFSLYWCNDAYLDYRWRNPIKVTLGIQPRAISVREADTDRHSFTTLDPYARVILSLGKSHIEADYTLTTSNCYLNGDQRASTHLFLPFDSTHSFTLSALFERKAPDYYFIHTNSNGLHWDFPGLQKTTLLQLEADLKASNWGRLTLTASQIDHYTYLGTSLLPEQGAEPFLLMQARLIMHLELWNWLHYDMQQMVQYSGDATQLPVPLLASKNSFYGEVFLFKHALRLQCGLDLRFHTPYHADAYNPAVGAFYRQNEEEIGGYFWGDVFANLQIQKATLYVKVGHLNALWEAHPEYFLLPHYPGNPMGFYYGVFWQFFD